MGLDRRSFLKIAAAITGMSSLGFVAGCSVDNVSATDKQAVASDERIASFVLLSDTHLDPGEEASSQRFAEVLRQISEFEAKPDSIFIVGDVTNDGNQKQYDCLLGLIDDSPFELADFTFACGNHDQCVDEETEGEYAAYRRRFVENTGVPSLYYEKEIAGQHVIVLGPDEPLPESWLRFQITQQQLDWLDERLSVDEQRGVVSYVFCHEPIDGTVTGTYEGQWGPGNCFLDQGEAVLSVLKKHPRCVFVSGHTHIFPGVEATDPDLPVFVNTGSAYRSYYSLGKTPGRELVFDGVQMNIFEDRLEFNFRNFKSDSWEGESVIVGLGRNAID